MNIYIELIAFNTNIIFINAVHMVNFKALKKKCLNVCLCAVDNNRTKERRKKLHEDNVVVVIASDKRMK